MTARPIRAWRRPLCALLAFAMLTASSARANDEQSGAAAAAGGSDAERRISAQLDDLLQSEASRAFTWRVTWTAIYGAVAVASLGGALVLPRDQRPSMIIGAISAGVSTAYSWFLPLAVEADAEHAEQISSDATRGSRLRELYEHSAEDESNRVRWPWHVFAIVSAAIPAAIIWIGYDQPAEAAFSFVGGLVLGELQLLTQPTRLRDTPLPASGTLRVVVTGRDALCFYTLRW